MSEHESPNTLSSRTTPTWEVELLISGVAVFAMLQLPGWLDDLVFALEPRFSSNWRMFVLMFYFYAKSAAVVLAITFAMHLLLRAQWIALVGMHSVYPEGVRLDKMRMGAIQRAIEAERIDSTSDAIERADNRASVVFAIGVTIAQILGGVCIFVCGSLAVVTPFSQVAGWNLEPTLIMFGVFAVIMLPSIAATTFDYSFGQRLRSGGNFHRAIESILRFYTRIGLGRRNNRIIALLASNGGEKRMMALVFGVMFAAIIGVTVTYIGMRGQTVLGSYGLFPDAGAARIDPSHYDDQRTPTRDDPTPYVQSMAIAGPYLKLVVPYKPRRDERAMRDCAVPSAADATQRAEALLGCLQTLRNVFLDGQPLVDLHYEIASDPRTDRPALLAMIDIRALPAGRHELRVAHPLRDDQEPDKDDPDAGFDSIPFWK